jgi:uncharacterized protein YndB with AHSA1/START domain
MNNTILNKTPDCEIVTSRVVDFSREMVFKAWTNPDHLKNWWGPKGFTNTFHQFDLRPNGKWSFTMHGPDGKNYQNECIFIAIDDPGLIVLNHVSDPKFQVVASFKSIDLQKTIVEFKMVFNSPEECNKIRFFVIDKNEENLDRLEEELKKMEG